MYRVSRASKALAIVAVVAAVEACSDPTTSAPTASAPRPSLSRSTITATPVSLVADGASTSAIIVQLRDSSGASLTHSGGTLTLQATLGSVSSVVDHKNGTYAATLTAPVSPVGPAVISAQLNGHPLASTWTDTIVAGAASPATSTVSATDSVLGANGVSSTAVTVQLRDAHGNPALGAGLTIILTATSGTLGPVTANGPTAFSATLTTSTTAGRAIISATLNGQAVAGTAAVRFASPGQASPATSTVSAGADILKADGVSSTLVTVQLRDMYGSATPGAGQTVTLLTSLGTLGPVTASGTTTFAATLTSSTTLGTDYVSATLNGQPITGDEPVLFVPGPIVTFAMTAVDGGAIPAQRAGAPFAIRITAQDAWGHTVPAFPGGRCQHPRCPPTVGTAVITSTGTLSRGGGTSPAFFYGVVAADTLAFSIGGSFTITATHRSAVGTTAPITVTP